MKSRRIHFCLSFIPLAILTLLTSCGEEHAQKTSDSLSDSTGIDSVMKTDTLVPSADTTLPFEQDTQKIIETLDLLDSIRQAKYN
jgi:hypothetical protein